ncbi:MAG: hypothetical protein K2Z81_23825, partial [Cyanobacteria bacterium]|nr:hypothetical protein [Cyanobacteriota bacterium]
MKRIYLCVLILLLGTVGLVRSSTAQGPESNDPIYIYRQAGISQDQEGKILKMVQVFESQQKVKAKKVLDLYKELRGLQLQP